RSDGATARARRPSEEAFRRSCRRRAPRAGGSPAPCPGCAISESPPRSRTAALSRATGRAGRHLGVRVHGLGDADELAGAVELVDPRAHVLGHDLSSYETPSETSNRFMIQALYLQPARRADYIRALFTP